MAYDIRPLSFGEILDRAFRVYLDNFVLFFGIGAVVFVPSGIVLASAGLIGNVAALTLYVLFLLIMGPIMQAALTIGITEAYLDRPTTIADAYAQTRPILVPYLGTYLLIGVLFIVPAVLAGLLAIFSRPLSGIALFILGVAILYFLVCWTLVGMVMIVERQYGMKALRRSRELVLGSWWLTVGILFTAGLIAGVPSAALRFVWGFIPVLGVVLSAMTQAVSSAYSGVALVIYYIDRRCRTEDFDLRLLAEQVRAEAGPASAPGSSSLA